jgi:hypothetical protein
MNHGTHTSGRGSFVDRVTQRWVRATGRAVTWLDYPWLEGPVGDVNVIGTDFFHRFAERRGWTVIEAGEARGLLEHFAVVAGPTCEPAQVDPEVARFYERTSDYDFDVWSEWSRTFRPFGGALGTIFSRRLQQLNVPLSPLDTKLGITSEVIKLVTCDGQSAGAAWIRETVATGRALYVGSYSSCHIPGFDGPCLKVAFPLPRGYALVIMKPASHADGSFTVRSEGVRFGDSGFYFFVEAEEGQGWVRYVRSLKETIHVFRDERGELRADHELRLWGARFLRLHYRMRRVGTRNDMHCSRGEHNPHGPGRAGFTSPAPTSTRRPCGG